MQAKWDGRYRDAPIDVTTTAEVLARHRGDLPVPGRGLDLACGLGANALFLARAGWQVDAWDLSAVAIERLTAYARAHGLAVDATVRDVVAEPPPRDTYDLIVVTRFLVRDLCPSIAAALKEGGLLLYQTFYGTGPGPANPAYRLEPGELPRLFPTLHPLDYREAPAEGEAWLVARREEGTSSCRT